MCRCVVSQESTLTPVVNYILQKDHPIGIYIFGIAEVRSKVAAQVEQVIKSNGSDCHLRRSMFSLPNFAANGINIMLIDLPNIASENYNAGNGVGGAPVDVHPNYGLRREAANRLRRAGASVPDS